jgi:protein TonB
VATGAAQQRGGSRVESGFGQGAYRPGGGVQNPVPVRQVEPSYTTGALGARIQGEVHLEAVVLADGTVGDVQVVHSLDARFGLDQAAVEAAKHWLFKPGRLDDTAVPVVVTLVLTFKTQDDFGKGAYQENNPDLVNPVVTRAVEPKYTSDAMRAKIQGEVKVEVVVKIDGTVGDARVTQSLDAQLGLDEEALKAARQWTFKPGTLKGKPVPVLVHLTLTFRLH